MIDSRTKAAIAAILVLIGLTHPVHGQSVQLEPEGTLTIAIRGLPLDRALEEFAATSGQSLVYESAIVADLTAYCVAEGVTVEAGLRCILGNTQLDYFRLSSGTIVLAQSAQRSPLYGYITGLVRDRDTGHPLAEANVRLIGTNVGAATNAGGTYVLPPLLPGTYEVTISHVSYYSWSGELAVGAGNNVPTAVELQPKSIPISPIVVDGTTRRLLSHRLGAPEARADLAPRSTSPDPYNEVTALAGVRSNDATADLLVDGADAGDMRMSIDGAPLYLPRQSIGLIGPFGSFALDRITIHRAGYGVAPGSVIGGIVEAEHGVDSPWSHLQVDPTGLNGRLKFGGTDRGTRLAVVAAGRVGSWDVYAPSRYEDILSRWSAADPFLIVAPFRLYEYATDAFVTDTLGLRTVVDPAVNYADGHAAFEYRPSLLRTLSGSLFLGRQGLAGGRNAPIETLAQTPQRYDGGTFSAVDDYVWRNTVGQVQYTTFVGRRTLATAQLFGSSYRLVHAYDLVDNLNLPVRSEALDVDTKVQTIGLPISDTNSMESVGLRLSFDHARGAHQLTAGFESTVRTSSTTLQAYTAPTPALDNSVQAPSLELGSTGSSYGATATTYVGFVEDDFAMSEAVRVVAGIRTTFLDTRGVVYAEPRVSINFDDATASGAPLSVRMAAGVYRQYETQVDLSALNAGSLLPTVRLWLPIDRSVRPPLAYHLSAAFSVEPASGWTLAANGFGRFFADALTFDYSAAGQEDSDEQSAFLTTISGRSVGFDAEISRTAEWVAATVRYAYVNSRRESPDLFDGRVVTQPDTEPHRLTADITTSPLRNLVVRMRWRSGWGRTWAYSRAYYDYFGHIEALRVHEQIDFGNPDAHSLPAEHRLDLGIAYSRPVGPFNVQLRTDVINVLNRDNVASYRIQYAEGALVPVARPEIPRIATVSARVSWRLR